MDGTCLLVITNIPWQGSLFGPYTPLQQLDMLADHDTKSYIVGSTNSLLLQQRDRYSDILVNVSKPNCFIDLSDLDLARRRQRQHFVDFPPECSSVVGS